MRTLCLNTATALCSVALFEDNTLLEESSWTSHYNESEELLPQVKKLLASQKLQKEEVDRVLVCVGPGGFTSCRVGVSAANMWSFALQVPVGAASVFDLLPHQEDSVQIVSANPQEAWVLSPGKEAVFVKQEDFPKLPSQHISGIAEESWQDFLKEQGFSFEALEPHFSQLEGFEYGMKPVQPWYFKDAKITWSKKIAPSPPSS